MIFFWRFKKSKNSSDILMKLHGTSFESYPGLKSNDIDMDVLSESNVWATEPTNWGVIVYSIVVPIISGLGVVGNALILAVLSRKSLKASTYTYLAVLAGADLVTCALLIFSGLARGVFWGQRGWVEFDAFVHLPIGSVSSNIAVWATVCVTLDRMVLVSGPPRCKPPKFCSDVVARKVMICSGFFSLVFNIPYCFIYTYNDAGELTTTDFFSSRFYTIQNWFQLVMFGLVPAVFLLVGNVAMCIAVRKVMKQRQLLLQRKFTREGNCLQDQARLTITLVGIVFMFLVGEVPTHLASRRSAVSILYGGDATKVNEIFLEKFRIIATLLNAISSAANFILYCLLSPQFLLHLKILMTSQRIMNERDRKIRVVTIDVNGTDSKEMTKDSTRCKSAMF